MGVTMDFSFTDYMDKCTKEVYQSMEEAGRRAVEYNKKFGSYQNRTGHLRASNDYEVKGDILTIKNDADYASHVEHRGYMVASTGALVAEKELKAKWS